MEDSGDESEDGDSSDKRVPASRQRGEEQLGTNTQWPDFLLYSYPVNNPRCARSTPVMVQAEDVLVMH